MTIEISGNKLTFNNVDPFLILVLLADKVDKSFVNDIAAPNFSLVVRPSRKPNCKTKEGDYAIVVRKDNGEEIALDMPHRGAKMLYILYDKLYRSGGAQWVENCAAKNHNLSTFRTHAKNAVEDNNALDNVLRYWCGFEDEKRTVGKNQLKLRRIRIPNNRIVFEDAAKNTVTFEQLMEQLPPLEELFGFKNKTTERIRQLRSQKASEVFPHS